MKFIFITLIFLFQVQSLLSQEEGCVKGDCENGTGVFVSDGIKYIGTFVNGYLHGKKEKIITPDGSVYEG
ncbi:MAG: membrane-binding protein, partial [Leptospiraceae bacterium]|nr:membrane-binding protein [Leptospiraceae bacterium]